MNLPSKVGQKPEVERKAERLGERERKVLSYFPQGKKDMMKMMKISSNLHYTSRCFKATPQRSQVLSVGSPRYRVRSLKRPFLGSLFNLTKRNTAEIFSN